MSEYVLISDIHANYPALSQVVEQEGLNAEYIVLGDIVGLNAYPSETISELQLLNKKAMLAGNHDKAVIEYGEGHVNSASLSQFELYHTLSNLSVKQVEWMLSLPHMGIIDGGSICVTHAKPWPSEASGYEPRNNGIPKGNVPHFASKVADDYEYVFHGHTHKQYDLDASRWGHNVHFVNPGSLGYDHTYSVIDTETGDVTHKSVGVEEDVKAHVQSLLPDNAPHTSSWF